MSFFRRTDRPYFEGWYFKHQTRQGQTLALIPAFHIDSGGCRSASLQVISNDRSWWLEYPAEQLLVSRKPFQIQLGLSRFGCQGIDLQIQRDGLSPRGALGYGPFAALQSDIMGPFRFFSGMQCTHGVVSMRHTLSGSLKLNGETLDFSDGIGYIETDRGYSFPSRYLWTQCAWDGSESGNLMLAIATIPLPVGGFSGCICSVFHGGREYPSGNLPGRPNRGLVLLCYGNPPGEVSPGSRASERAEADPPGSGRGPHGADHPRESLCEGMLSLPAWEGPVVSAYGF